jgi:cobalt-zinc-cadmium efflux system membrane fusion protein
MLGLAIAVLMAGGCGGEESKEHADAGEGHAQRPERHDGKTVILEPEVLARAGIRTATVEARGLAGEISTTGQVDFDQSRVAHVSPRVSGRVQRVAANLGDAVARGGVLLLLDSMELAEAKSTYLQTRAREDLTRQNFDREAGLHAERISSRRDLEEARAAHQEASAARTAAAEKLTLLGLSREELERIRPGDHDASIFPLRAPLSGTVVEKHATVGEVVSPERNLMTVADLSSVWIWIDVHERDLQKVHLDDEARVQLASQPATLIGGRVRYLAPQVDPASRTVRARIDVPNAGGLLRPGEFAEVWLHDPHAPSSAGAPAVPESAVQREGEHALVFVAAGPGRFQAREVVLGRRMGEWAEVLRGVRVGEEIAVEGTFLLKSELSTETMGEGHAH